MNPNFNSVELPWQEMIQAARPTPAYKSLTSRRFKTPDGFGTHELAVSFAVSIMTFVGQSDYSSVKFTDRTIAVVTAWLSRRPLVPVYWLAPDVGRQVLSWGCPDSSALAQIQMPALSKGGFLMIPADLLKTPAGETVFFASWRFIEIDESSIRVQVGDHLVSVEHRTPAFSGALMFFFGTTQGTLYAADVGIREDRFIVSGSLDSDVPEPDEAGELALTHQVQTLLGQLFLLARQQPGVVQPGARIWKGFGKPDANCLWSPTWLTF